MKNPFANLASLFSHGSDSVVGIDFGSSAIKIVQLKKKNGQAVLETYGSVALGPYAGIEAGRAARLPSETLVEALKDVMLEAKITARACGSAVPASESLIAVLTLPVRQGEDISRIIPIEARKYIPTPISEVALDWRILQRQDGVSAVESDKTEVLITAVHRDANERLKAVLAGAGLDASFLEIEAFSTARAAALAPDGAFGILDIGASASKVTVVDSGVTRDAHTIVRGGQDVTLALSSALGIPIIEAEEKKRIGVQQDGSKTVSVVLARVLSEAREVFRRYEIRMKRTFQGVFLSGGGALLSGFHIEAEKEFGVPVSTINPMARLAAPAFLSPLLARAGPEFAVAIGVALRRLEEVR
ncbi:MAG: Type IV pilus assembly protein PilM [Parcubacteria group bacterium GW2011_GWA2_47_12]|nr:MAG: Type IV pilus assembly protein PilM [Parcubacteria group bacterium GW2011_GWA2_47_12]